MFEIMENCDLLDCVNDETMLGQLFNTELVSMPGETNTDVTVSQLLNINTQDLTKLDPVPFNLEQTDCMKENLKPATSSDTEYVCGRNGRFAKPLSASQLYEKQRNTVLQNTRRHNNWCINLWKQWAQQRNCQPETCIEPGYPIPLQMDKFQSFSEMDYWLQRFIFEIRRKDGSPYPPGTLSAVAASIQRHLRIDKCVNVTLFKTDDPTFAGFRKALDSRMRELTNEGIGVERKSAAPITKEDELTLWESGVLSVTSAKGLSSAVFLYNGKFFGLRGGEEHIGLLAEQFEFGLDVANDRKYVKFIPRIRKNAQGGLKQSKKAQSLSEPIKHYDQEMPSTYSVYHIYETYCNLIPKIGPFYRKPLDGMTFSANNIPQKDLKCLMKTLFQQAGISLENRNISNHSGRVTLCTTLYNERFSDKSVMSRSKHTSSAVKTYQREAFPLQSEICSALEPVLPPTHCEQKPLVSKVDTSTSKFKPGPTDDQKATQLKPEAVLKSNPKLCENMDENTIQIYLPNSVKKLIVVKSDGKNWFWRCKPLTLVNVLQ